MQSTLNGHNYKMESSLKRKSGVCHQTALKRTTDAFKRLTEPLKVGVTSASELNYRCPEVRFPNIYINNQLY